jgi:hypothetical protein
VYERRQAPDERDTRLVGYIIVSLNGTESVDDDSDMWAALFGMS